MRYALLGMAMVLVARQVAAQTITETPTNQPAIPAPTGDPAALGEDAASKWSFSLTALTYIVPGGRDYVQPTLTVDRDWFHLEARYNYEALDTASVWVGYNFSFGDAVKVDITPMVGGVVGATHGVAPGYEITLARRGFEFYTEGEFVFDADDSSSDFFYSWSELTYSFTDWSRAGVAAQRTKTREDGREFEIGPMIGLKYRRLDFNAYALFPSSGAPTVALGIGIEF